MTQDTKLQQLVINKLTTAQYQAALNAGTIDPNQLYMTTDSQTLRDVTVGGSSIVSNNTAALGTMALETASNYSTKAVADTLYAQKALETTVAGKLDKISTASKVYGTDVNGNQTSYDITSFGNVDDVKVGTTSVVANKIATLGTMAGQPTTNYYTKSEIDGKLSAGMHYKGTVASYSNLPSSNNQVGDLYNVTDTGSNYAWDGTAWDKLSENIDLSGVVPNTRTINGKELSTNITLSASDVNALPSSTVIPTTVAELTDSANYVTVDTEQNITGEKTFIGPKRIKFKQSNSSDKLGFTLYNTGSGSNSEVGAFEYNNSSKVDSKAILVLNSNGNTLLGFRYWGSGSSNILAGVPSTSGNYYIPINLTNGTTSVKADKNGIVNISSLLPDALPSQSGNSGKFLTTNGTTASWATVSQPSIATTSTAGLVKPDGTTITITNDGTISAADVEIDEETITKNGNNELQTIGVIDSNDNNTAAIKTWTGTKAQYDALLESNWLEATQNTNLGSINWRAVAYGDGKFVAISNNGYISISIDGETWTTATQNSNLGSYTWNNLIYDGTRFVTTGSSGCLSTSTDGETWTTPKTFSTISNTSYYAMTYNSNNNIYILIGSSGNSLARINYNLQGSSKSTISSFNSKTWYSLVYDGTKYVALSSEGYITTSSNGETWTTATQNSNLGNNNWRSLVYDGDKFIALSYTGYISTSTNGTTWTTATQNSNLGNNKWKTITYGNRTFVAIGNDGYIGISRKNIQSNILYNIKDTGVILDETFIASKANTGILSISQNDIIKGTFNADSSSNVTITLDSYDNKTITKKNTSTIQTVGVIDSNHTGTAIKTWTGTKEQYTNLLRVINWNTSTANSQLGSQSWRKIAYDGTKFVAIGGYGYISTSTNGTTWTTATQKTSLSSKSTSWISIVYDGIKFVALSSDGYISTSSDGATWTTAVQKTSLSSKSTGWMGLIYDGTKFIALSSKGYVSTSIDGTTWATATQNSNLGSQNWMDMAYGDGKYVVLGYYGYVSTSIDGTTWATATQNSNLSGQKHWNDLIYGNGQFVAIGENSYVSKSTNGTSWSYSSTDNNLGYHTWEALAYNDGKYIALGGGGYIATSYNNISSETLYNIENEGLYLGETLIANTSFSLDNKSITSNNSNEIQTVGVINLKDNTSAIKIWTGNEEEYNNLSDTGIAWSEPVQISSLGLCSICYDGTKFLAIGYSNGNLYTSLDGISWTYSTGLFDGYGTNIAYGNGLYLALGDVDYMVYVSTSIDGEEWSEAKMVSTLSTPCTGLVYGNGKFIAFNDYGSYTITTDGTDWSESDYLTIGEPRGGAYGNGKFIIFDNYGNTSISTNGTEWTSGEVIPGDLSGYWTSLIFTDSKFIAINEDGYISTTIDGITWTTPIQDSSLIRQRWGCASYGGNKIVLLGGINNAAYATIGTNKNILYNVLNDGLYLGGTLIASASSGTDVEALTDSEIEELWGE